MEFTALHEERIRLLQRYMRYNNRSNQGRPKKSVIASRLDRKSNPILNEDHEPVEEYYETVQAAARAMHTSLVKIMNLAGKKRVFFSRKWRYATHDDLERHGIL